MLCRQHYAEYLMANNRARLSDEALHAHMKKKFPGQFVAPMSYYCCEARKKGIALPRYDKDRKEILYPLKSKGLEAFLCDIFRQNVHEKKPDSILLQRLNKAFPHRGHQNEKPYTINDLRGRYNFGRFDGRKYQSICYDKNEGVRTQKEETSRLNSQARKKWHKNHPEASQQKVQAMQAASGRRPSQQEKALDIYLDSDWIFNDYPHNPNLVVIDFRELQNTKRPDWIHVRKKWAIEYLGDIREKIKPHGLSLEKEVAWLKRNYRWAGWRVLCITYKEFRVGFVAKTLKAKIRRFAYI